MFFFFNDTATTEIYTLSLHDALPISSGGPCACRPHPAPAARDVVVARGGARHPQHRGVLRAAVRRRLDRKSTRLNSSHANISYAVFCLKKKKQNCNFITSTR